MRRIGLLLATFAMMLGVMTTPSTASAAETVVDCNGQTVVDKYPVGSLGTVWLCRRDDYYFGMYVSKATMPAGRWGTAWLHRFKKNVADGTEWSCDGQVSDTNKGNGRVLPGDTWCHTPVVHTADVNVNFRVQGIVWEQQNGKWVEVTHGWTRICNRYGCY